MPTSSNTDPFTHTLWLVVALFEDGRHELVVVKLTETIAEMTARYVAKRLGGRVIAIPLHIPLPVLVKNALEALDGDD